LDLRQRVTFPQVFGALLGLLALIHIPSQVTPGAFDRNAAPQFILLVFIGFVCAVRIVVTRNLQLSKGVVYVLGSLMLFTLVSLILSDDKVVGLIGDTGRFNGLISLWSLTLIAITATSLSNFQFFTVLFGASWGVVTVTLLGLLQSYDRIFLPSGGGAGSTLGNLDFLSAWIGTTLLLAFLFFREYGFPKYVFPLYLILSLVVLFKIEAKQGFVDLALVLLCVVCVKALRVFDFSEISTTVWKVVATLGLLLWSEAIYLIPMANIQIPGIGDDVNVRIRADFWYSAAQMFFHNFAFGVGPDNYGNYYEKYRSLSSVENTEFVIANDAHSSMMQSFATLGIFSTLAFLIIILMVIYSCINLINRKGGGIYGYLLIAFLVFYTNSLISPVTLPNKALFWVVAGFVIGEDLRSRNKATSEITKQVLLPIVAITAAISLVITSVFAFSFLTLNSALATKREGGRVQYVATQSLPCVVYSNAQVGLVDKSGGDVVAASQRILETHPRCLDALGLLANAYLAKEDYVGAKPIIYQLLDVAPARKSVVRLAAIYALGAKDQEMQQILAAQGFKLGLLNLDSNG